MANNFKNPWGDQMWAEGTDQYTRWLPADAAYFTGTNPNTGESAEDAFSGGSEATDPCSTDGRHWSIKWFDSEGYTIYKLGRSNGFSQIGAILTIAHAYREQATTEAGRKVGYVSHNWWNFGPLKSRSQKSCKPTTRFACFDTIEAAFAGYYDRITSEPDFTAYKNDDHFNPSYPELGKLFKKSTLPAASEINTATRVGTGKYVYCGDAECSKYGQQILDLYKKYVIPHFKSYLTFKMDCLEARMKKINSEGSDAGYVNTLKAEYLTLKGLHTELDTL